MRKCHLCPWFRAPESFGRRKRSKSAVVHQRPDRPGSATSHTTVYTETGRSLSVACPARVLTRERQRAGIAVSARLPANVRATPAACAPCQARISRWFRAPSWTATIVPSYPVLPRAHTEQIGRRHVARCARYTSRLPARLPVPAPVGRAQCAATSAPPRGVWRQSEAAMWHTLGPPVHRAPENTEIFRVSVFGRPDLEKYNQAVDFH